MTENGSLKISDEQVSLLERLCNASAVSGDEAEVRKIVIEEVRAVADEIKVDVLGNVLARRFGDGENRLKVMLAAHMDEVGMMVIHDEGKGIFRFELVGGIPAHFLPAKSVAVGKNKIPGIIGAAPIHLTSAAERQNLISVDDMRLDVGPDNGEYVEIGDRVVFSTEFADHDNAVFAKALDDRIGVSILIQLLKNAPKNIDLFAAFTVQEEVGQRGASAAAFELDPDIAIVIDSTPANDQPAWDEGDDRWSGNKQYNTRIRKGPAIYIADRGTISDPRLIKHFVNTSHVEGIPFQLRQPGGGRTDAAAIHKQRSGIPSISISVPARYLHSPVSICDILDWMNTQKLIYFGLVGMPGDILAMEL
ncbi:MAG: M42 family metallopeptidase [Anaerolineales bacterium]|jgi:putative aminopeptidase FrvX